MALATLPTFSAQASITFATALVNQTSVTASGITAYNFVAKPTAVALPVGSSPATVLIENIGPDLAYVVITTAAATTTATQATVGASTIVVALATGILIGQVVVAAGIPAGTIVQGISGTTITISQPTTAALATTGINFVTAVVVGAGTMVEPQVPVALGYVSSGFVSSICPNSASKAILNCSVGI